MRTRKRRIGLVLSTVLILAFGAAARARNVDLATVPPRESVQLTIYNSEDITPVSYTHLTLPTN